MNDDKATAASLDDLVSALERRLNMERVQRRRLQVRVDELCAAAACLDASKNEERLEQIVEQRTNALRLARDEAVAASHSKSNFLANMSHEIRTPLTSIIGFAELLEAPDVDEAEKRDAARTIIRNGRHLLEVINDILDLSKIESNQLQLERIEVGLPKLLSDIEALASNHAQERSLLFTIEHRLPLPPSLVTDPVRLKQILLNFCSNAIKFSSRGEVRLEVGFDVPTNRLRFDVTDSGIGMSASELERLFKPFVQADVSTTRKFGGTGLGLYISKQLADMLGAEIRVASAPGKGSRFTVSIPLGTDASRALMLDSERDFDDFQRPAFQITAIDLPDLSGRVLVAEDGADNQRLLASLLRKAGVEFDIVGNGRLAVDSVLQRDYALVLMDIQMPEMDGVTATKLLRSSSYRGPIVALTANVMQDDIALYRRIGCNDVLCKPIDRSRFYDVLRTYVGEARPAAATAEANYERELAELTAAFESGLVATCDRLDAAVAAADWAELGMLFHTLKGTAGSYGFAGLARLAAEGEVSLVRRDLPAARKVCAQLRGAKDRRPQ